MVSIVIRQRFALSLDAKTVAPGCSEGNAIELARLIKDSAFQRRSLGVIWCNKEESLCLTQLMSL